MNSVCKNINNFDFIEPIEIVLDCDNFDMSGSLTEIILHCGSTNILFNMSNVLFVDNDFFDFFIDIQKKRTFKSSKMILFGFRAEVLTLFYLLNIDKYFEIYSTKNDAIKKLNPLVKRRFKIVPLISFLILSINFILNCNLQISDFI